MAVTHHHPIYTAQERTDQLLSLSRACLNGLQQEMPSARYWRVEIPHIPIK